MRIACFLVLLLASAFGADAQSVKPDRVETIVDGNIQGGKLRTAADRNAAAGKFTAGDNSKLVMTVPTVPDRVGPDTSGQAFLDPFKMSNTQLETVDWTEIEGWTSDDHIAAFATFLASCRTVVRGSPPRHASASFFAGLQSVCRRAINAPPRGLAESRIFFEKNFRPMRISPLGENNGFLTGYYEPIIEGSRVPNAEFKVPLYRTPGDLTKPYHQRAAIEDGALAGRRLEICWLKDPTDLFFAQIQGSARVKLVDEGKVLRLNYSSHNGWPYTAVGRILIAQEIVPREEMSMDRIREWIEANPEKGKELRRRNKSYVFFRETGLPEHLEPVGAQGISLTPGRSIATDKSIHIYGTPFFIDASLPFDNENSENKFQRLMVSQDTGSAIIGPARADLYFGAGSGAAHVAGRIRHPGYFTIMVPREIDPVIAGARTPLPRPRPVFAGDEKLEMTAEKVAPDQKENAAAPSAAR